MFGVWFGDDSWKGSENGLGIAFDNESRDSLGKGLGTNLGWFGEWLWERFGKWFRDWFGNGFGNGFGIGLGKGLLITRSRYVKNHAQLHPVSVLVRF